MSKPARSSFMVGKEEERRARGAGAVVDGEDADGGGGEEGMVEMVAVLERVAVVVILVVGVTEGGMGLVSGRVLLLELAGWGWTSKMRG